MPSTHLTFVEEIALLALDDHTGELLALPPLALDYALAGAILCELAALNRIDTDPTQLVVLSREPTGDPLLDRALAKIVAAPKVQPVAVWLNLLVDEHRAIEDAAFDGLVARGILRRIEKKFLWVFAVRRYPTIDNQERTEVRTRLSALILGDELPDPRDATLISLLKACRLTDKIFTGPQFAARADRIATLAKMDLVGREVATGAEKALHAVLPIAM
jgi:hypothetical protein